MIKRKQHTIAADVEDEDNQPPQKKSKDSFNQEISIFVLFKFLVILNFMHSFGTFFINSSYKGGLL